MAGEILQRIFRWQDFFVYSRFLEATLLVCWEATLFWSNRISELTYNFTASFLISSERIANALSVKNPIKVQISLLGRECICSKCYNEVKRNFRSRRLRFNTSSSPLVIVGSVFCIRTLFVLIGLGCSGTQYDPKYWCHQQKVKAELIGKHQGRSLIYNVKSSGPKMEPCNWGTLHLIVCLEEHVEWNWTNCWRQEKKLLIQSKARPRIP